MGSTLDEIAGLISKSWNNCNMMFLDIVSSFPNFMKDSDGRYVGKKSSFWYEGK